MKERRARQDGYREGEVGVREGVLFLCLVWIHSLLFCFFFEKVIFSYIKDILLVKRERKITLTNKVFCFFFTDFFFNIFIGV